MHSSRAARLSGSRQALKCTGRGRGRRGGGGEDGGASINLDRRRLFSQNFYCTFRGFRRMYVHTSRTFPRIRTLRPSTTFPSSRAFPCRRGTVEERTLFPSGPPSRSTTSSNDSFFFLDNLSWYSPPSSSQILASRLRAIRLSLKQMLKYYCVMHSNANARERLLKCVLRISRTLWQRESLGRIELWSIFFKF